MCMSILYICTHVSSVGYSVLHIANVNVAKSSISSCKTGIMLNHPLTYQPCWNKLNPQNKRYNRTDCTFLNLKAHFTNFICSKMCRKLKKLMFNFGNYVSTLLLFFPSTTYFQLLLIKASTSK